ncbi:MAG: hypothetical protein KDA97_05755 [Acidimicrobiales bacterium]|nr:hypothetical protein [Acidimicrobiales bacterium]
MSTYLAVGSVCWDVVDGSDERRLGGSVLFASRVARAAGWDARIVTSGTAELEATLAAELPDVELVVQRSPVDTVMAFPVDADHGPRAVPTRASAIDEAGLDLRADVVHLAPIMGEVTREVVDAAAGAPFTGITPQGLLRTLGPADELQRRDALGTWWAAAVDAAVVSEAEFAVIDDRAALADLALAITRGERGCIGRRGNTLVDLPGIGLHAVSPERTIGAGDVFAAAWFLALASGSAFADALDHANRTAAAHVGAEP